MQEPELTPGTIKEGEYHPAADSAMHYVKDFILNDVRGIFRLKEALASCAIEGNRLGEICGETLQRILDGKPVSDRYLLGLAWFLKMKEEL